MKRVLIVGSGKRVVESALPVFLRAREQFQVAGVFSRTPKRIVAAGEEFEVSWRGPTSKGDLLVLVEESAPEGRYYSSSTYSPPTSGGSPLTLTALPDPGAYEVRYFAEGDGKTLARAKIEIVAAD